MALTKCDECGGQVSDRALSCPHCGAPRRRAPAVAAAIVAAILALGVALASMRSAGDRSDAYLPLILIGVAVALLVGFVLLKKLRR